MLRSHGWSNLCSMVVGGEGCSSSCCAPPRTPLTLRGSSGSGSGRHAPASASPALSSTCTRGRLLLWAPSQPCLPAGSEPCQRPARPHCTPGPVGAGAAGRALPPVEKLPDLPFQSAVLGTHTQKANTDGKPQRSPACVLRPWVRASAWAAKADFVAIGN